MSDVLGWMVIGLLLLIGFTAWYAEDTRKEIKKWLEDDRRPPL